MSDSIRLLLIDDDESLLLGLAKTIGREGSYQVTTANNGNLGIQLAEETLPHLIICDVMMPPPDGWAVLQALSRNPKTAAIPFIFLTARADEEGKIGGIALGADDFITKPFNKNELIARIHAILRRKGITESNERLKNENEINKLEIKVRDLIRSFLPSDNAEFAEAMSQMLSLRDNETEKHARRVVELSDKLARELGLKDIPLDNIRLGALLHDIGKVGIPDFILLKPGALTDEERKVMMTHPTLGKTILEPMGLPIHALDLVLHHHEQWNGNGYPDGLTGENIPLPARIFAIVDVWDALTSDRPYRKAWTVEKTIAYITEQAGKHFDPNIVEKFITVIQRESKER